MRSFLSLALVIALFGCDPAPMAESSESGRADIVNGVPTLEHPEIGKLEAVFNGATEVGCTATVVSPKVILTASHCVQWKSQDLSLPDSPVYTFRIKTIAGESKTYGVIETVAFSTDQTPNTGDVALARLAWAVPASVAVPRTISFEMPAAGSGESVTTYGYGCGHFGWSLFGDPNLGKKQKSTGTFGELDNACAGDSGGPTLRDVDDSIIGVTSGSFATYWQSHGWTKAPLDILGDVVAIREQLLTQIAAWSDDVRPPDPSEEPAGEAN